MAAGLISVYKYKGIDWLFLMVALLAAILPFPHLLLRFVKVGAGVCLPCDVGLNVVAHVSPFERKKGAWFTIYCSMRL